MIRATIWTVGLFGAGAAIVRAFPGTWTEPLVLLALGLALLFASARTARVPAPKVRTRAAQAASPAADPPSRSAPGPATPVAAAAEHGA